MTEKMLENRIRKLQELEEEKKWLEKQIEAVKTEIKVDMDKKGLEEQRAGEHIIRFVTVVTSRFDSKAFKSRHEGLYKKYMKAAECRRFTIA